MYTEDRVKNGVFQAMMDVGLVNDGPVGVDYCCLDEAVNLSRAPFVCAYIACLNTDHARPGHHPDRFQSSTDGQSYWIPGARGRRYLQGQGAKAIRLTSITFGIDCRVLERSSQVVAATPPSFLSQAIAFLLIFVKLQRATEYSLWSWSKSVSALHAFLTTCSLSSQQQPTCANFGTLKSIAIPRRLTTSGTIRGVVLAEPSRTIVKHWHSGTYDQRSKFNLTSSLPKVTRTTKWQEITAAVSSLTSLLERPNLVASPLSW